MQPLTDDDRELIELARRTVDANTDGPDGVYTMGAAVRGVDGRMYAGINLYHFTGGPCAELVALGRARAEGARELTTIVAVGNEGRGVVGPCGRDRQILVDYHPRHPRHPADPGRRRLGPRHRPTAGRLPLDPEPVVRSGGFRRCGTTR